MILGICADVHNDLNVNLIFFEDTQETPTKIVELKQNNIYAISYMIGDFTYESIVKLISIKIDDDCYETNSTCHVKEFIGDNNIPYINYSKDELMKAPPISGISLIVDTSETFDGNYESIKLNSILDCKLIDDDDHYEYSNENCSMIIDGHNISISYDGSTVSMTLESAIKKMMQ